MMPDDLTYGRDASRLPGACGPCVVVGGSLDGNEPVSAVIEAARLMPQVEVRLTGDVHRVPLSVRRAAPSNVVFTGWLDYSKFLGELLTANVVAVFSTDPHSINRPSSQALALARPPSLS